jgi:hypothetical protein
MLLAEAGMLPAYLVLVCSFFLQSGKSHNTPASLKLK